MTRLVIRPSVVQDLEEIADYYRPIEDEPRFFM